MADQHTNPLIPPIVNILFVVHCANKENPCKNTLRVVGAPEQHLKVHYSPPTRYRAGRQDKNYVSDPNVSSRVRRRGDGGINLQPFSLQNAARDADTFKLETAEVALKFKLVSLITC